MSNEFYSLEMLLQQEAYWMGRTFRDLNKFLEDLSNENLDPVEDPKPS